jgi:hypothetical protein
MRKEIRLIVLAAAIAGAPLLAFAQQGKAPKQKEKTPPPSPQAAAAGDVNSVIFNWGWYMGMLRGSDEIDSIASLEMLKATGTIWVNGQPCTIINYRGSLNYQIPGMRASYSCTQGNGQPYKNVEVLSGNYAWDEDMPGAGLEPGKGTVSPKPDAVIDRQIRMWASPQGAVKAAEAVGEKAKVSVENGKAVIAFPIPGVPGAMAKATLNDMNQAERVEVRRGKDVTEFTYENYSDYNPPDDRVDCFLPGHIVEKKNGMPVLDLKLNETETGNLYVVIPVPDSIQTAEAKR